MKTLKLLICLTLLTSTSVFANKAKQTESNRREVAVLSTKRDVFYFKIGDELMGATIEVRAEDGSVLMSEKIQRRRELLDFYFEKPGHYAITITKGDKTETFEFVKASASPVVEMDVTLPHMSLNH